MVIAPTWACGQLIGAFLGSEPALGVGPGYRAGPARKPGRYTAGRPRYCRLLACSPQASAEPASSSHADGCRSGRPFGPGGAGVRAGGSAARLASDELAPPDGHRPSRGTPAIRATLYPEITGLLPHLLSLERAAPVARARLTGALVAEHSAGCAVAATGWRTPSTRRWRCAGCSPLTTALSTVPVWRRRGPGRGRRGPGQARRGPGRGRSRPGEAADRRAGPARRPGLGRRLAARPTPATRTCRGGHRAGRAGRRCSGCSPRRAGRGHWSGSRRPACAWWTAHPRRGSVPAGWVTTWCARTPGAGSSPSARSRYWPARARSPRGTGQRPERRAGTARRGRPAAGVHRQPAAPGAARTARRPRDAGPARRAAGRRRAGAAAVGQRRADRRPAGGTRAGRLAVAAARTGRLRRAAQRRGAARGRVRRPACGLTRRRPPGHHHRRRAQRLRGGWPAAARAGELGPGGHHGRPPQPHPGHLPRRRHGPRRRPAGPPG